MHGIRMNNQSMQQPSANLMSGSNSQLNNSMVGMDSHVMVKSGGGQEASGSGGLASSVAILSADFDFLNECANTISLDKK